MSTPSRSEQFTQLLVQHQSQLVGYIFALVRDLNDTQDVFQKASLVLWRKFDSFDGVNFVGWACRTAQLEAMSHLRAKRRADMIFSDDVLAQLSEAGRQTLDEAPRRLDALRACLAKLSQADRKLVDLCYLRGQAHKQVAENLGRSAPSLCRSLRRIRRILLACVAQSLAVSESSP